MDPTAATVPGSAVAGPEQEDPGLDTLQFREEIQRLMTVPPENASSFTALLELPPTQAMELLHLSPESEPAPAPAPAALSGEPLHKSCVHPFSSGLAFPTNAAQIERAAKFPIFGGERSPETGPVPSNSGANVEKVKSEAGRERFEPQLVAGDQEQPKGRSLKRKDREKKVKVSTKKNKTELSRES
ncbi:hypothetical protein M0R45_002590 [Rubus argutus]|uniref:Uncharacterized protein n=1 Tax=Rubus argutus TaxID=59490 RepID=A0AAW1VMK2_RUBAR